MQDQEAHLQHKRSFLDFLDQDEARARGTGVYADRLRLMASEETLPRRLCVSLSDLRQFDGALAERLTHTPFELIPAFEDALAEHVGGRAEYAKLAQSDLHVGFRGEFGIHRVSPRELTAALLGHLCAVEGIATKCSLVRPKVVRSVHYCEKTKQFHSREYRDATSAAGIPTGSAYPVKDDAGNPLTTEFGRSTYRDSQTMVIQEMPELAPAGQLPRSVDIILEDDLVDSVKPGDRVRVVGVYRALAGRGGGSGKGTFRSVVIGNNVVTMAKDAVAPRLTDRDTENIHKIGADANAFELMARSLAPSIYGHDYIKKALLLLLLGGVEKNLPNGTHLRGDINILLVGDPSTAKSQLLRFVLGIAPLAVSTTGRGSSGVGLTAAVTTDSDTGERRLEAGAMVLADRGVVCIDEFDKMSEVDRVAIHEVMEQQTVTIAKAGIHTTLNARCSVIAAANPIYGQYNRFKRPQDNVGLPDSLLSRFDLLFIVLDNIRPDVDKAIATHVLRLHQYRAARDVDGTLGADADAEDADEDETATVYQKADRLLHPLRGRRSILSIPFIKKYIHFAKTRVAPVLSNEASEFIAESYGDVRSRESDRTLPLTVRTLETLIRLATAHARCRLGTIVTREDAEQALAVMTHALYSEAKPVEKDKRKREADAGSETESDDDGGAGDGAAARRAAPAQPPRQRRRAAAATAAFDFTDEPPSSPSRRRGARGAPAAAAEESVAVVPERARLFMSGMRAYQDAHRGVEDVDASALLDAVNADQAEPFARAEADAILRDLEEKDRVMYRAGRVHFI